MITGCSKGIGRAILDKLLLSKKYMIYAITQNAESIRNINNENLKIYKCDLTVDTSAMNIAKEVMNQSGGIDVLINNAGMGIFKHTEDIGLDDWKSVLTLNLTVPFIMVKNVLPYMKSNNYGRIINITSDADHIGFSEGGLYCASKFGLRGFSDSLRDELVGFDISVTSIGPGRVDTFFNGKKPGDRPNSLSSDDVADQVIHVLEQRMECAIESIYLRSVRE